MRRSCFGLFWIWFSWNRILSFTFAQVTQNITRNGVFEDFPVTPLNGNSSLPGSLRFPDFRVPTLEVRLVDQALKAAQRQLVDTLSLEDQLSLRPGHGNVLPNSSADLLSIESKLHPDAKRASAIGYVLEGMTRFIANRSQLTREQVTFGLPKLSVTHPTITRRCPYSPPPPCEVTAFRNITGLCNNVQNPWWGTPMTPFSRFLPHAYSDAVREPRTAVNGSALPNPRFISSTLHYHVPRNHSHITQMLAVWTQFVEHDLSHAGSYFAGEMVPINCCTNSTLRHPECFPVDLDVVDSFYEESDIGCMSYTRSVIAPKLGCVLGPRDQANQVTHFLDGSTIYGSTDQDNKRLREGAGGRLWMTDFENGKSLLPEAINGTDCRPPPDSGASCFDSGNVRVNQYLPITAIYTLFVREHNRLVEQLGKLNTHWDDEQLFQAARKIVIAQIQHITFSEYLPLVLGKDAVERHNVQLLDQGFYRGYSSDVNPSITNEFATAGIKFWHSLVDNRTEFIDRRGRASWKSLTTQWFQPYDLYFAGVLDGVVRGLFVQPARAGDQSIVSALTSSWLRVPGSSGTGLDIASLTIQRGRDHGLAGYNSWREACGLPLAKTFDDLRDTISESNVNILKVLYGSVNDIDLYSGGLSERHAAGSLVGPVFGCIIGKQFHNVRRGDRYWYELDMPDSSFTLDQLNEIRKVTLARIVCDNGDAIAGAQPHVMLQPNSLLNAPVRCKGSTIPTLDLKLWKNEMPNEPTYSKDDLLNIIEKSREAVNAAAAEELARAQSRNDVQARIPFNIPTESVRLLHLEANTFLQSTKHFLKRELPSRSNMSSAMAKIKRFNALVSAKLEGPTEGANCTERVTPCDHTSKFRTFSGWCNNLEHPSWGSAERIYGRTLDPSYADGVDEPRNMSVTGVALPSPRAVQVAVITDLDRPHPLYTHILMNFGQFLDHDITLTPIATALNGFNFNCRSCDAATANSDNCRPISIPDNDKTMSPFINETTRERRCLAFIRSSSGRTALGAREQINQNSAYIDGSQIYGSSLCKTQRLRTFSNGRMNTTKHQDGYKDLLPQTIDKNDVEFLECKNQVAGNACFLAGDTRENENPGLTISHTIWMRYHNVIADELHRLNPSWDDERLFQESRRIVVAVFQHIAFNEYLPRTLGQAVQDAAGLRLRKSGYFNEYDSSCDATITNEFAAAAFRFGHTLVRGEFGRYNNDLKPANVSKLNLFQHFARGDILYENFGVDQVLIGFTVEPMQNADSIISKSLTDQLFEDPGRKFSGQDLISINIMRGRDHGVPGYNEFREHCNLTRAADFSDLVSYMPAEVVAAMQKVYAHVDDLDLYLAGISEYPVYGGVVGPTFACLLGEQFYRTRKCDRFWYETGDPLLRFSEAQLSSIRKMTLAKVVCANSDTMDLVQRSVFDLADQYINPYVRCSNLPAVDLSLWRESGTCNVSGVSIALGHTSRVSPCTSCTCTKEGPLCQSVAVRNCNTLKSFPLSALMEDSVCKAQCAATFKLGSKESSSSERLFLEPFAPFL
ncbi:Peroxidasin [Hypsibius exemplaris]|uniref:Peroxidasin n=1 Tax=Hypsibius exemplaris TaxID=2072580 RepID=A0A1W0XCW4_HYPEX|nr:Peroxidasin [Hypsibius exemplaris]